MSKILCPVCGKNVSDSPFKTWKYKGNDVKRFKCPNCQSKFNLYQGAGKTFTIPKPK